MSMSITGLLIGFLEIVLVVVVLLLLGALVQWGLRLLLSVEVPPNIVKLYIAVVGLVALIMLIYMLVVGTAPFHVRVGL